MQLPDMSGGKVYEIVEHRWPKLPVIFISASASPELIARFLAWPHATFLQKPFDTEQLMQAIAAVTEAP